MGARYTHNYAAFNDEVLSSGFMVAEMHDYAEVIKGIAIAISPVRTGEYLSSFVVDSGVRTKTTRRAFGRVTNTASYAAAVEFGFGPTPRYRVLGKALKGG